jgi:hypothetical protein
MIKDIEKRLTEIVQLWQTIDGPISNKSLEAHRQLEMLSIKHYEEDIKHLLMLLYIYESESTKTIEEIEADLKTLDRH